MMTKFISSIRSETGEPVLLFALSFTVIYGEEKLKKKESEGWEAKSCTVFLREASVSRSDDVSVPVPSQDSV